MSRRSLCIVTPALASANNGNWQTASRWRGMLRHDYRVLLTDRWQGEPADAMLALHARRSAESIARWSRERPGAPLAVVLTGTDLYGDIPDGDERALRSLELADRLVVLHERAGDDLPLRHRAKVITCLQSTTGRATGISKSSRHLRAVWVGHLRDVKAPETFFAAARGLAHRHDIRLDQIGEALEPAFADAAQELQQHCPSYRWLGAVPHPATRDRIQRAHLLVNTSRMEGGAHVVMEAVRSGTPVLASRIAGNVGLLGPDYGGYFEAGDGKGLATLIERCRDEPAILERLRLECSARAALFEPAREKARLHTLLNGLYTSPCDPLETPHDPNFPTRPAPDLAFSRGGCGCKIAPGVLSEILKNTAKMPMPPELLVGIETADDAAVYQLTDDIALIATTDFFMPIVDDPFEFGRIAAANAISDVYAMGGKPILALALVGMPISVLSTEVIGRILEGGESVCRAAGIPIAGGHTIDSVEPIYGLVALGLVHPKRVKRNADARPGDRLVLGKPLGVGILSAALKADVLSPEGYALMIATTTKLNTPGPDLAALDGVHALTDVTGFGLAGHALELARGADAAVALDWAHVPLLAGVRELAAKGWVTGASGRNWSGYGAEIELPGNGSFSAIDQALLSDPQTSGGLLVSCDPGAVAEVLAVFARHGFDAAAEIGEIVPRADGARLRVR